VAGEPDGGALGVGLAAQVGVALGAAGREAEAGDHQGQPLATGSRCDDPGCDGAPSRRASFRRASSRRPPSRRAPSRRPPPEVDAHGMTLSRSRVGCQGGPPGSKARGVKCATVGNLRKPRPSGGVSICWSASRNRSDAWSIRARPAGRRGCDQGRAERRRQRKNTGTPIARIAEPIRALRGSSMNVLSTMPAPATMNSSGIAG
jgi:hypothetical protein